MLTECEVEGLVRVKMEMEIKMSDGEQRRNSEADRGGVKKLQGCWKRKTKCLDLNQCCGGHCFLVKMLRAEASEQALNQRLNDREAG